MSAQHTPGPWEVVSYLSRQLACGWYARRKISLLAYEWMESDSGRRKRFKSEASVRAAIAKATEAA